MGLSSNARLLTITARLTSNEYESQQITNAKLRLATESQAASDDYIHALNQQAYSFVTYDGAGNAVYSDFSANTLYQYSDAKNQFVLANAGGQVLVKKQDVANFASSGNLYQFLENNGVNAQYVDGSDKGSGNTESLGYLARKVNEYITGNGTTKWEEFLNNEKTTNPGGNYSNWLNNKESVQIEYMSIRAEYDNLVAENELTGEIDRKDLDAKKAELNTAYVEFMKYSNFGAYMEDLLGDTDSNVQALNEYRENLAKYTAKLEKLGVDPDNAYTYDDGTKAQWFTNLWYRMNGESTVKSSSASQNYQILDNQLASSPTWVRDSLLQGIITIEQASYTNSENTMYDENNPFASKLNGINWETKIFTSCPDIIERDNSSQLSKAEATYTKRTAEINAKDEKYQRKLNLLNTEHQAIQTEYESVKSAMDKNIDRSFKTFNS